MNNDVIKNTVKATNQNKINTKEYGVPIEEADLKVLCIGNSITRHSVKEEIGWFKECGMAASCLEKDYVHQLMFMLEKNNKKVSMEVYGISSWEMDFTNNDLLIPLDNYIKQIKPDIVILRLGENFNKEYIKKGASTSKAFEQLYQVIKNNNVSQIIFTNDFWKFDPVDNGIKFVARKYNEVLVDLGDLGDQGKYKALGEYPHFGVSLHPNDAGMLEIAKRIYKVIKL